MTKLKLKFKARINHLELYVDVQRINFDCETIECFLVSPEEGDMSEFDFDDIELYQLAYSETGKSVYGMVAL